MGLGLRIAEEALLAPAVVAAVVLLGGRWLSTDRILTAALATAAGFIAAFAMIRGLDLAWPRAAADKLPLIAIAGLALGGLAGGRHRGVALLLSVVIPVVWVAWRPVVGGDLTAPLLIALGGLASAAALATSRGRPWRRWWTAAAIGLALAGTALFARTVLFAELALACAAVSLAGIVRPGPVDALWPAIALLTGLGAALALFSAAPVPALVLAAAIPLASRVSPRLSNAARLPEPLVFVGLGLGAAAIATALTRWTEGPPLYYG